MSNRRHFLKQTTTFLGGATLLSALDNKAFALFPQRLAPSDQVNIAAIGIAGMGWANVKSALKVPGVNLVALCDVDKNILDKRMGELASLNVDAAKVKTYSDYRRLLEQKDVDAVIIGTPDHWHALIMIDACQAGKDVYVEKPVGNSIEECRAMVAAQKKYNKVVQAGQWQRSQKHFRDAVDFVHSGQLGNIRTVKVWCYQGWMKPGPKVPDSAPPAGVDYAMWLGPAEKRPFNSSRFHFNFRWFWDYAGGLMTDWGVHLLDYALLGMKAPIPKTVAALGGIFAYPELAQETPDTLTALYEFDGFNLVWDHAMGIDNGSYGRDHGIAYIGNNGTLVLNRGGWEVIEEKHSGNKVSKPLQPSVDNGLDKHWENFISVVKSRKMKELNCPIETGAHVATVAQMGNISFRSGQRVVWDKAKGKFTDNKLNEQYLMAEYHNGYKLKTV
ncbi:Gfo/Idh/MocA family oxidoreductase [Chitinophagaceae bacterium LB-8]|uniref:Gfo/Idh/MocA family oxidoreductase n=1 Tax=Paraflavisolibacter caeni TaxID=2982496 RepID=A0A9X2XRU7_9BACT|nr:Gfo/Idh/MocA family oxidoreductase [Paraflavisolibacter caeni]MCU7547541.1 Gfo/Idh/MocA family oxidoreductase [Paraflavisolibacter caeni]